MQISFWITKQNNQIFVKLFNKNIRNIGFMQPKKSDTLSQKNVLFLGKQQNIRLIGFRQTKF